jgi:catechol 2,3-dioxygenase-like lactoylglutathione lyase family enzyme
MGTRLNHVAIVSEQYAMAAQFYQAVFGFLPPSKQSNFTATTVGDGYVGININPRRPSRPAGLDHFGVEVDNIDEVLDTLRSKYPEVQALKRPSNRPFAGLTGHDPDGNIFDFSQQAMENRGEIYKETETVNGWTQPRVVTHYALRTQNPEPLAKFYVEALGLSLANKAAGDPNFYLTDGRMTLVLMKWDIRDFAGTGIVRPGPHHIGIRVENLEAFKRDLKKVGNDNPSLEARPLDNGPEGEAIANLLARKVPYAQYQLSDNNNVLIAVSEGDVPAS